MNFNSLKARIDSLFQKSLVRHTLWMLLAKGLRLVTQAGYFVIIARALGAEQYGAFVAVTALVSIVAPFSSWGSGDILIKHVSRDRSLFKDYWGNALFMVLVSGWALVIFVLIVAHYFLPAIPWQAVFCIAVSDLLFLILLDIACKAFMAVDWLRQAAQINFILSLKNLISAAIFVILFKNQGLISWSIIYFFSTAIASLAVCLIVNSRLGTPRLALSRIKPELVQGFYFSIGISAQTINSYMDQTLLASMATLEATGIYAAAYRLIDVALIPVYSLVAAAYAKFFKEGQTGIAGSLRLAKRLALVGGAYGLVAAIGLFVLAPVVPFILGHEYEPSVQALRWLSPLPFIQSLQFFAADTLTGAGFQGSRSILQVIAAAFNVLLNLQLIPLYSWKGSAWSSLASDAFLAIALWVMVAIIYRQQAKNPPVNKE